MMIIHRCTDIQKKLKHTDQYVTLYIGQSGRNIKTRYLDHYKSYKLQKTDFTLANNLLEKRHNFPLIGLFSTTQ